MELHISKNLNEVSNILADWMVQHIKETLQKKNRFTLALSGGNTPQKLHELLASTNYKNKIDWNKMHIFFGDERFVPFNDERNNAKMAFDSLLNHVPIPASQIHIMQTENISPEDSAKNYEEILKQYFPSTFNQLPTTFDLVMLGMGDDGHTLSLFPHQTEIIHETKKWCVSFWLASQNMFRVTITHPVANNSSTIIFLVSGSDKAKPLREVLKGKYDPDLYPSQIIKPTIGELHWFIDEAAASLL
ncbi:MAG: 6-phosphogluconolactonase [Chitinophagaceae bacterium]